MTDETNVELVTSGASNASKDGDNVTGNSEKQTGGATDGQPEQTTGSGTTTGGGDAEAPENWKKVIDWNSYDERERELKDGFWWLLLPLAFRQCWNQNPALYGNLSLLIFGCTCFIVAIILTNDNLVCKCNLCLVFGCKELNPYATRLNLYACV